MSFQPEERPLVLIADDSPNDINVLVHALQDDYFLAVVKRGRKTLEYAHLHNPDLILLDIMMPDMNGYDVCRSLQNGGKTKHIPVVFISGIHDAESKTRGFSSGAVDYITKPFNAAEVKARVNTHLSLKKMREGLSARNRSLQVKVDEKTAQIQSLLESNIQAMSRMAEINDPYTAGHQQRVAQLAVAIARKMGMPIDQIENIRIAGILHDIGKIRLPTGLLTRPGKLLPEEYEMLKIHPKVGYDLLKTIPFTGPVAQAVYQHHERLDGTGYPLGLSADQILPEAKVLAVADVMEAMSSHRPYRPALGAEAALKAIQLGEGIVFDRQAAIICRELFINGEFAFESFGETLY